MKTSVELIDSNTGEPVEAELSDEITVQDFLETKTLWRPLVLRAKQKLEQDRRTDLLPEYANWDWTAKEPHLHMLATRFLAIRCRNALQGIVEMQIENIYGYQCRIREQRGKALVYLDYVEVAPWNVKLLMEPIGEKTEFRGVGSRLMEAVVRSSVDEGFKGRVGLHALPSSEVFYEVECGMTRGDRDPTKQNLVWFEYTPEQARAFLPGDDA